MVAGLWSLFAPQIVAAQSQPTTPTFSIADARVTEGDSGTADLSFTVTLSPTSDHDTYVLWSTADGTAKKEDYTGVRGNVLFSKGTASKSVTVKVIGDELDEADETLTVTLASPRARIGGSWVEGPELGTATATGTIVDDDSVGLVFTPGTVTVTEAAGTGHTATYTVALASQPTAAVSVAVATKDGTVATVKPATLNFTTGNWSAAQQVTVTAVDDGLYNEPDRSTGIGHTASGGDYGSVTGNVPVSVEDDEGALVLSRKWVFVYEGLPVTKHQTYQVSLATKPTGTVTVTPSSRDPARVSVSGPLTFTTKNWAEGQNVFLTGVLDADGYDHRVMIDHAVTGYKAPPATVRTTVKDYHGKSLVLQPRALELLEGQTGTYQVRLRTDPLGTVTVTPSAADTSVATVSGALTFNSSNWSIDQPVTVTAKALSRGIRQITVFNSVSGYSGYTRTHPGAFYNPDVANDAVDKVAVTVASQGSGFTVWRTSVTVTEAAGAGRSTTYNIALARKPSANVLVGLVSEDPTVARVSPSRLDFTPSNWKQPQTVTVTAVDDDIDNDPDRTTVINHVGSGAYGTFTMKVTVTDDEAPGVVVSKQSLAIEENGSPGTYTLKLATQPEGNVTVTLSDNPSGVVSFFVLGVQRNPSDPITATFNQNNWNEAKTVAVWATNDDDADDESVTISHAVTGYGDVTTADSVAVSVTDEDTTPTFAVADARVAEGDSGAAALTFTVTLSPAAQEEATVDWATSKAAADTATPGTDYTAGSGTLTFAEGVTSKSVTVAVKGDVVEEADETLTLTLSNKSPDYTEIGTASATGTIVDDDADLSANAPAATITADASPVTEGTVASFTVELSSAAPDEGLSVTLTVADAPGSDFVASANEGSKTLAFDPGDTSKTYAVPTVADTVDEASGDVTVTVSTGTGYTVGTPASASVTVEDDDAPAATIKAGTSPVTEGTAASFTVELSTAAPTGGLTVALTVADVSGSDFVASTDEGAKTLAFNAGDTSKTYTVATVADTVDEANGDVTVTVGSGTGYTVGTPASASVTVEDDDAPAATITAGTSPVTEGTAASFTVELSTPAPTGGLTIALTVADASGSDFVASSNEGSKTLTFAKGDTSKTYTVATVADTVDEANGDVTVTVGTGTGYTVGTPSSATVTVTRATTTMLRRPPSRRARRR